MEEARNGGGVESRRMGQGAKEEDGSGGMSFSRWIKRGGRKKGGKVSVGDRLRKGRGSTDSGRQMARR